MKKILTTILCCLTILLYIPFSISAKNYDDELSNIPGITDLQLSKIQQLYNSHSNENLLIYYSTIDNNLVWTFDIKNYDSSNNSFNISERFLLQSDGSILSRSNNITLHLSESKDFIIFLSYNNNVIFKNQYLVKYDVNNNSLLLSKSYENIVRTQSTSAAASNRTRYFSYVDYDIRYTIKGSNFDVYYLVNDVYKLIQSSINTFTIIGHESKYKFKDSSILNDFPEYPTIPNNSLATYNNEFKLNNFLFKSSIPSSNELIVKAPDTDNLLSDGNSNSQSATSNNNNSNQLLDNTVNQMESLENGFKNDLNSNLDNINANNFNISGITQLSNAANFVRVQFDNLTKNNPFGTILGFSLFLGLSLLIIGKRL